MFLHIPAMGGAFGDGFGTPAVREGFKDGFDALAPPGALGGEGLLCPEGEPFEAAPDTEDSFSAPRGPPIFDCSPCRH